MARAVLKKQTIAKKTDKAVESKKIKKTTAMKGKKES